MACDGEALFSTPSTPASISMIFNCLKSFVGKDFFSFIEFLTRFSLSLDVVENIDHC